MLRGAVVAALGTLLASAATPRAACAQQQQQQPHSAWSRTSVDVLDYDLSIDLPERGKHIEGDATLTIHRLAPFDTLVLDLVKLDVSQVQVNGRNASFTRAPETLRVYVGAGSGDTLKVRVRYAGEPEDGLIIRDTLGQWSAFGDNWPNRARYWIPSVDHPSDKATVSWTVRAPPGRAVIANGMKAPPGRIRAQYDRDLVTHRFRENRPIPTYVMVIGAGALQDVPLGQTACGLAESTPCVTQDVWVLADALPKMPGEFAKAGEIVSLFSRLVAPFPYEKLAHVQSATIFGGMENASAIFYDGSLFPKGRVSAGLIAHETAHQWFGDAVTERDWPHLWLSEGFATYFAALWAEHAGGREALQEEMKRARSAILADSLVMKRPVIDTTYRSPMELLNRNSYEKGGWVLHMLRGTVGDSAFFRGLREYYSSHRHGNADSKDLQLAVEHASGQSLGWFFDQWLRRPGYPELTIRTRADSARHEIVLSVEQGARFGAYRFVLPFVVRRADGSRRKMVYEVRGPRDELRIPMSSDSDRIEIDPDVELLARVTAGPQ